MTIGNSTISDINCQRSHSKNQSGNKKGEKETERVREKFNAHDDGGGIILLQQGPWKDLSCY